MLSPRIKKKISTLTYDMGDTGVSLQITLDAIQEKYPLHWCVWHDETEKLEEHLSSKLHNQELHDPHGRTPLLLAVALGHEESVNVLLRHSCDATAVDKQGLLSEMFLDLHP